MRISNTLHLCLPHERRATLAVRHPNSDFIDKRFLTEFWHPEKEKGKGNFRNGTRCVPFSGEEYRSAERGQSESLRVLEMEHA